VTPIALDAHNPGPMTGTGNHTWCIQGRVPTLVDAGTGDPRHLAAVEQAFATSDGPAAVIITHAHGDHMSGGPALAARFPRARFAKIPWPERDPRYPVAFDRLADGQRVEAGDGVLEVLHTPGHAPDHLCLWHAESRSLFCGDLMIDGRTVVIPASHGGSLGDYLRSLERIVALEPRRAYPAHGPVIESPVDLARTYLQHRARRERQVVGALADGAGSPAAIAARIYASLPDELRGMAEESVLAHLVKLEGEGRARRLDPEGGAAPVFQAVESPAE
jgi:ribonuclease/clavin/mitogillin